MAIVIKYERICPLSSCILQKCTRTFQVFFKNLLSYFKKSYVSISTSKYAYLDVFYYYNFAYICILMHIFDIFQQIKRKYAHTWLVIGFGRHMGILGVCQQFWVWCMKPGTKDQFGKILVTKKLKCQTKFFLI